MCPVAWNSAQQPTTGDLPDDDYYRSCLIAAELSTSSQEREYVSDYAQRTDDLILPENYAGYLKSYSKPEKGMVS